MRKGSKLYSIIRFKCPHCHEGEFLESRKIYSWKHMGKVRQKCNQKFSNEPGFYQGSFYVTYALGVALFVTLWVATSVLFPNYEAVTLIILIALTTIILSPYTYSLSKIIWANFFFSYNPINNDRVIKK